MELSNDFRVGVPPSEAWSVLTDVERIAPHLPGAQLQEIDGDEYRGVVKVKVGPITAQYKGTATMVERDETNGRVVLRCAGRDTRGQGNANATITAVMKPDGDGTRVAVTTDLTVTGKVAQFGRGVLADVSAKLMGQFVDALEVDIRDHGTTSAGGSADVVGAAGEGASAPGEAASGSGAGASGAAAGGSGEAASGSGAAADASGAGGGPSGASGEAPSTNGSGRAEHAAVGARESAAAVGAPAAGASSASPTTEIPAATPAAPSGPRQVNQPEAAPVDLLDAAGGSIFKRVAPVGGAGVFIALILLFRRFRGRHR